MAIPENDSVSPTTKEMMLGTLTHRAVLWTFSEPVFGNRLETFGNEESLRKIVLRNALVLNKAIIAQREGRGAHEDPAGTFAALVDRTGAASTMVSDQVKGMAPADVNWVTVWLAHAATRAALAISKEIRFGGFLTLRSEVPTQDLDWEPPKAGKPRLHQRLDLVGLTKAGVVEIIELKVTSWLNHRDVDHFPQLLAQIDAVRNRLGDRDRDIRARLLYVQADGKDHKWVEVPHGR